MEYTSLGLAICSLVIIAAASGLWVGADVGTRPKYTDEQTLVGGTIWSQIIIPFGLILSKILEEHLDDFIQGYFLLTGVGLCGITGLVLILGEARAIFSSQRPISIVVNNRSSYDFVYLSIGVCVLLAGLVTLAQFFVILK